MNEPTLTDTEREVLLDVAYAYANPFNDDNPTPEWQGVVATVEHFVAVRVAEAVDRERAAWATKIERLLDSEDATAVLHGVVGTTPDTYGGVTKDEALDHAGTLLTDLRGLLAADDTEGKP